MHLPELPTIFVKNGEERKVYFSVQARELISAGWAPKGEEEKPKEKPVPVAKPAPEPVKAVVKTTAEKTKAPTKASVEKREEV